MSATLFKERVSIDELGRILQLAPRNLRQRPDDQSSMYYKQMAGIVSLYNILCELPVAYLADEVGMGKTYQALGLACLLWNLDPSARVMIIAPRSNVQRKWAADYLTFLKNNYVYRDDRVVDCLLGRPVRAPVVCENLSGLVAGLVLNDQRLFLLRLTSFMRPIIYKEREQLGTAIERKRSEFSQLHFYPHGDVRDHIGKTFVVHDEAKEAGMAWVSAAVNQALQRNPRPIDLLIIDEAQNLRNSGNQTCTNLRLAFGLNAPGEMLAHLDLRTYGRCTPRSVVRSVLLMSATPAHSDIDDIARQLEYASSLDSGGALKPLLAEVREAGRDMDRAVKALSHLMVRRFRMFGKLNKYGYRDEQAEAVEMDPMSELSMALVNKHLYRVLKGQGNRFKVGFLSSFESLQESVRRDKAEEGALTPEIPEGASHTEEDGAAPDGAFVSAIDKSFANRFPGRHLVHPKQRFVVDRALDAIESGEVKKLLVFVRRVASVSELARDITSAYDRAFGRRAAKLFAPERSSLKHEELGRVLGGLMAHAPPLTGGRPEDEPDDGQEETSGSNYLKLFRSRKRPGGRFRALFHQSNSLWWFFEENWIRTLWWLRTRGSLSLGEFLAEHGVTVDESSNSPGEMSPFVEMQLRLADRASLGWSPGVRDFLRARYNQHLQKDGNSRSDGGGSVRVPKAVLRTSFWNLLMESECAGFAGFLLPDGTLPATEEALYNREQLKAWISKSLRMFESILDLAFAYRAAWTVGEGLDDEEMVGTFLQQITTQPKLKRRLELLVENEALIERTLGHDLEAERYARLDAWHVFDDQEPVRGVVGGTGGRDIAAKQFNTPFFPDVLVCTDVLREGVDLHLFCDEVQHYGLAFSPGDLEQRIGRVDRYFSYAQRTLERYGGQPVSGLFIKYPYVANTLDEVQLARVLSRRQRVQMFVDRGLPVPTSDPRVSAVGSVGAIEGLLLKPSSAAQPDPFPTVSTPEGAVRTVLDDAALSGEAARKHLCALLENLKGTVLVMNGKVDTHLDAILEPLLFGLSVGIVGAGETKVLAQPDGPRCGQIRWQRVQAQLDFVGAYRRHVLRVHSVVAVGNETDVGRWQGVIDAREGRMSYELGVSLHLLQRRVRNRRRETLEALVAEAAVPFCREGASFTLDADELLDLVRRVACTADRYEEAIRGMDQEDVYLSWGDHE